jgi:peptidoglycan/xylan/chitin deacetylase (PgdA/CDA1 family)
VGQINGYDREIPGLDTLPWGHIFGGKGITMLQFSDALRQHGELWDLYTRKEEYSPRRLDQYGCFPFADSSYQEILTPVVSQYLKDNGFEIKYPDNRKFAVCLTHDVDDIYPPLKHTLLSTLACLKQRNFGGLRKQIFWKLHGKEKSPYWNFTEIMDLEERYGARSSFYFLATDSDVSRFRYNIEDLENELGQIIDKGWEVGLHGGYYAYDDLEKILVEKKRLEHVLGRKVTGYRNHYLRFQVPDSWEYLAQAGFGYDTTLGYNETVGFKNGMCYPFRPYNLHTDREVSLLEIPLTIMDSTLFEMVSSYDEAWELVKQLVDTVASCQGVLTLNWHSNSFNCPYKAHWPRMYEEILKYCQTKNAWLTNGSELITWWKKISY